MEQYERVRSQYPGHLVLFRVGDFYETFGDDAKRLASELEVALTARAADGRGERIPMAGVPHHAVESYLGRLVRKGYKVAICDQVEDARFAKGLIRREVTRVVTPGTAVDDRLLPGPEHNFLAAIVTNPRAPAAAVAVDVTTGEVFAESAADEGEDAAVAALAPFGPREILYASADGSGTGAERLRHALAREFPRARLEPAPEPISPGERPEALASAAAHLTPGLWDAVGRVAAYVRAVQPRLLPYLEPPRDARPAALRLDAKTLRHLEISRPMNPDDASGLTLVDAYDETSTAPGRRTLGFWLRQPLADVLRIRERHAAVETLVSRGAELVAASEQLRAVPDLSRVATRVAGRTVRPPELLTLKSGLEATGRVRDWVRSRADASDLLRRLADALDPLAELQERLASALPENPPPTADAGGVFRTGYSEDLDGLHRSEKEGLLALEALERRERERTGIKSLKIGYTQVFGYYFEVSRPHLSRVPPHLRRKQTLAQAERFTSDELADIEAAILSARGRRDEREAQLWDGFLGEVERSVPALHRLGRAVGELDALLGFARVAQERGHVRPEMDESPVLKVHGGRHPVLERLLGPEYVPNDTDLDAEDGRLLVLTGPNMSGKSTYMRQVGLLVVLAQAGAFVPAQHARIGVANALFTRMGFTDEIGRGKSSFMVEMSEVSDILRTADARSLVLLDEVGRGTSTFDGLAIAWATLRHLHDRVRCRTVLATHYHQLTELVAGLAGARNAHLAVRDRDGEVVFLHRLVPGSTDRSYGLHVARRAGLPEELVREAERLLRRLESQGLVLAPRAGASAPKTRYTQAILLASEPDATPTPLEAALRALDPERMSPLEALAWIHDWRRRLDSRA
jgi:DNA mismatch repair protein MutS